MERVDDRAPNEPAYSADGPRLCPARTVRTDSGFPVEHLSLRDALRAGTNVAIGSFALKRALAMLRGSDREGYADARDASIRSLVQRACD